MEGLDTSLLSSSNASPAGLNQTRISKLPNGLIIASEETYSQMTSFGLYGKIGSRFESPSEAGTAQLLERLLFKSTANRTHAETIGTLEAMGAMASSASHPELLELRGDILRNSADEFLSILSDSIICPIFTDEEVREAAENLLEDLEFAKDSAHHILTHALHRIAFAGSTLASIAAPESIRTITAEQVTQYMRRHFTAPRFVLTAASYDHDELLELARKYFSRLPAQPMDGSIASVSAAGMPLMGSYRAQYSGGMELIPREIDPEDVDPVSNLAIVFKGLALTDPNIHLMFVLSQLLGGGDSFSSGGPGKGIHSQLYRNVLHRHHFVSHCSSIVHTFSDISLFGIMADCSPNRIADTYDVICSELARTTCQLDEESVERAKSSLKTNIFYNLESRAIIVDDMARYILAFGGRYSAQQIAEKIDAVTVESLQTYAKQLLSSPPVVVACGPQSALKRVPKYSNFERHFERISSL